ncbi:hypothetical protein M758_UG230300 [Ceratodon purpureus]|nr:hypothetical protein M758_UG230300 [Ceratodon purpureus]
MEIVPLPLHLCLSLSFPLSLHFLRCSVLVFYFQGFSPYSLSAQKSWVFYCNF